MNDERNFNIVCCNCMWQHVLKVTCLLNKHLPEDGFRVRGFCFFWPIQHGNLLHQCSRSLMISSGTLILDSHWCRTQRLRRNMKTTALVLSFALFAIASSVCQATTAVKVSTLPNVLVRTNLSTLKAMETFVLIKIGHKSLSHLSGLSDEEWWSFSSCQERGIRSWLSTLLSPCF